MSYLFSVHLLDCGAHRLRENTVYPTVSYKLSYASTLPYGILHPDLSYSILHPDLSYTVPFNQALAILFLTLNLTYGQ